MQDCIEDLVPRAALRDRSARWWNDTKVTDDFLDPLFEAFFFKLRLPNLLRKTDYHVLARHVPPEHMDAEVGQVLDAIAALAGKAKPVK